MTTVGVVGTTRGGERVIIKHWNSELEEKSICKIQVVYNWNQCNLDSNGT